MNDTPEAANVVAAWVVKVMLRQGGVEAGGGEYEDIDAPETDHFSGLFVLFLLVQRRITGFYFLVARELPPSM